MLTKKLIIAMMCALMLATVGVQAGGDTAKGAELAADCAACHGDDGMGDEDIPKIAGMDAAKLAKALTDFKSGAVESDDMTYIAADLSDQEIADVAAYYATLSSG